MHKLHPFKTHEEIWSWSFGFRRHIWYMKPWRWTLSPTRIEFETPVNSPMQRPQTRGFTRRCFDQVDASSVSGCSSDSDEDSAVDIPTPPPTDHQTGDRVTHSFDTIPRSITPSDVRQPPLQAPCVRVLSAADSQLLNPAIVTSYCNAILSAECDDGSRTSVTSNSLTANENGNGKEAR